MKTHNINDGDKEIRFSSPKMSSAYFRSILRGNLEQDNSKKPPKALTDIEYLYYSLSSSKQFVINNLIFDLLSDKKRNGYLGLYLEEFLNDYEISYSKLASYISGYIATSITILKSTDTTTNNRLIFKTVDDVKSSIQKMLHTVNIRQNNTILPLVADFFCVSPDVLVTGRGKRYSIDFENLKKFVDTKYSNCDDFLSQHLNIDMNKDVTESDRNNFIEYIHHSARTFAQIAIKALNIEDINKILIEEECWIELDKFPIYKYYQLLSPQNQIIAKHVIENLTIEDITDSND